MKYLAALSLVFLSACSHKPAPAKVYICVNPFFVLQSIEIDMSNETMKPRDLGDKIAVQTEAGSAVLIPKALCAETTKPE